MVFLNKELVGSGILKKKKNHFQKKQDSPELLLAASLPFTSLSLAFLFSPAATVELGSSQAINEESVWVKGKEIW